MDQVKLTLLITIAVNADYSLLSQIQGARRPPACWTSTTNQAVIVHFRNVLFGLGDNP